MTTEQTIRHKDIALLELLDRVLDKGVIIAGDIIISVADIDLVYLGLRLLLCSVERMEAIGPANPLLAEEFFSGTHLADLNRPNVAQNTE